MNYYQKQRKSITNKVSKYYGCTFIEAKQMIRYEKNEAIRINSEFIFTINN